MVPYRISRRLFLVKPFVLDDHEMGKPRPRLRELLGLIVYQAMLDGMLKVQIGVERASGESFLKYFGPIHYDREKQIWWDMVAPPSRCYPRMLQICMSLARLQEEVPIKGVIPAIKHRRRLTLDLDVNEINCFEIAWDEAYALDRSVERTAIAVPGRDQEEPDDWVKDSWHPLHALLARLSSGAFPTVWL